MGRNSKQTQDSQRRKKLRAIEAFGGKCEVCGYDKCPNALEFHHVGKNKSEKPSYVIMRWSWERAKKELEKCILICANCHREVHYKERDLEYVRCLKPWLVVNCRHCKKQFETKNKDQAFCSSLCKVSLSKPWQFIECRQCKSLFETKNKDQEFCSAFCRHIGRRKVQRPNKEELAILIEELPWVRIGKMFGVSDNAVRKWARKYGLLV